MKLFYNASLKIHSSSNFAETNATSVNTVLFRIINYYNKTLWQLEQNFAFRSG